ncbi:MAG: ferrous iron transporter B, partial [Bacteroidota bacterium]
MKKIALFGNPNTGKSSLFNLLTGLNQKVGNFSGVTVEVKTGQIKGALNKHQIIDFPGTYSIFPRSSEEKLVYDVLSDPTSNSYPDVSVVVVDASNLERNLLLFDQIYDLNLPTILVLNMSDVSARAGLKTDVSQLEKHYPNCQIVEMNARVGLGKNRLIAAIEKEIEKEPTVSDSFPFSVGDFNEQSDTVQRREKIQQIVNETQTLNVDAKQRFFLDKWLAHPILGYFLFIFVLFVIFQSIFSLAVYPMDWIEMGISEVSSALQNWLPDGIATDLLVEGVIPGIGGVLVFIPQIALLFFFLGILEETGYLSRVIFLMDRLMRPLGLNGRSVVPLISSLACAIPGIMAARTIANWKERMITIFVAPLMSCSARIPVYTILIALVIPNTKVLGFINVQGLVLLGLYLLGLFSALIMAFAMKLMIRSNEKSFLMLELPPYRGPRWMNVLTMMWEKTRRFVFDAGKIIVALSILLWLAASYGPKGHVSELDASEFGVTNNLNRNELGALRLENSFIGIMGQKIEPVIRPLGYDWKIGIALITSFAAREVFVGTLATIYSVNDVEENEVKLLDKMKMQTFRDGTPVFTLASGISLMVFYVYALQCMATVAVVKRETGSWKWPILQLVVMGIIAYLGALLAYN